MNIYNDANDVHTSNRSHCGCNFQIILVNIYFFFTCFYSTLSDFGMQKKHHTEKKTYRGE